MLYIDSMEKNARSNVEMDRFKEPIIVPIVLVVAFIASCFLVREWMTDDSDGFPIRLIPTIVLGSAIVDRAIRSLPSKSLSKISSLVTFTWIFSAFPALYSVKSLLGHEIPGGLMDNLQVLFIVGFAVLVMIVTFVLTNRSSSIDPDHSSEEEKSKYASFAMFVTFSSIAIFLSLPILWTTGVLPSSNVLPVLPISGLAVLAIVASLAWGIFMNLFRRKEIVIVLDTERPNTPVEAANPTFEGRFGYDSNGLKKDASGHTYGVKVGNNKDGDRSSTRKH